jgi:undecaprenyl-diphosphatase
MPAPDFRAGLNGEHPTMVGLIKKIIRIDRQGFEAMVDRRHPYADRLMRMLTHLGGGPASILLVALMMSRQAPQLAAAGRQAAFALVVSHVFVQLLKRGIARRRPNLPVGLAPLIKTPDQFSFPSGHAAAALAVGLPLAETLPGLFGPAVLGLAAIVGLSRCYLGVHYPCDVIAGWVLAVAAHVFDIAGPL